MDKQKVTEQTVAVVGVPANHLFSYRLPSPRTKIKSTDPSYPRDDSPYELKNNAFNQTVIVEVSM
jgi:hypothetical protein